MRSPSPAPTGRWVDLVARHADERALASASVGEAALRRLASGAAHLGVIEGSTGERDRLVALLGGSSGAVEVGPLATVAPAGASFDLVVTVGADGLDRLAQLVSPDGRLVVLADNPVSPLRAFDRCAGRAGGPTAGRLRPLRRRLAGAGFESVVAFGLLRSSTETTAAFRLDLPGIAEVVLRATAAGSGRARRGAIGALRVGSRWGVVDHLVSAWLLIGRREQQVIGVDEPTGRIAVAANEQGVVLLGEGPAAVEKHYDDLAQLESTATALAVLEEAGVDVGTKVVGRPSADRLRLSWVDGRDLDALRLEPKALIGWIEQAAGALGRIQGATLDAAGQVLVHGDYWLGCIVARGDRIGGIIDWTDAHRGDPREDLRTLVAVALERADLSPAERRQALVATQRAHERAGGPAAAREGLDALLAR